MPEAVNHPEHYNRHPSGVECIDVVEHMGFNLGNVVKYLWRADEKGAPLEDLQKAAWYLDREIARRGGTPPLVRLDHDVSEPTPPRRRDRSQDRMTTTQPPLTPGQHVYIEAVAEMDQGHLALRPVSSDPNRPYRGLAEPTRCVWHPMPAEDSPKPVPYAEHEQEAMELIAERDRAESRADQLAEAIAKMTGVDIGEHSSMNDPWCNALEAAEDSPDATHVARLEAELAAAKAAYEGEHKAYLFVEAVTVRLGAEIDALFAERDALRKVYDAAVAYFAGRARTITDLRDAVDAFRAGQKAPAAASLHHDDQTMFKVYEALQKAQLTGSQAMTAIHELQNAGILFREYAREPAGEKAPADAPSSPRSDEPVADDHGQTTEAQGGAEAVRRCRSSYYTDIGRKQYRGDRIVECGRPQGHPGKHQGLDDDGEVLAGWEPKPIGALGVMVEPAAVQPQSTDAPGRYFCPTSGDVEDPRHGGFDVCCDRPDLHQPTDAQGRRDWAGEIAVAYAEAKRALPTDAHEDDFGREVAAALGLRVLEDERDRWKAEVGNQQRTFDLMLAETRAQRDELRRERDFARKAVDQRITEQVIHWNALASAAGYKLDGSQEVPATLPLIVELTKQRDEAAGKLDALRVGVEALAGQCRERALKRPGEPIPGDLWWIGSPVGVERELRALLAAPPTTTPDGGTHADPAV